MSEIKPVSIKTAEQRINEKYRDFAGMAGDEVWLDATEAEAAELRAALEALQAENAAQAKRIAELELSSTRYEKLRRLNAFQFQNIFKQNITSFVRFDELVDNLSAQKGTE
jgi:hypothetical protein